MTRLLLLALLAAGCRQTTYDRPTTTSDPGYAVLYPAYLDAGQVVSVDPSGAPILYLWDAPLKQANLVVAPLAPYTYPATPASQTTWAGAPVATFLGSWNGAMAVGDSVTLPLVRLDGLPDSVHTGATGSAVVRWDRAGAEELARVRAVVVVESGALRETLVTYYALAQPPAGSIVGPGTVASLAGAAVARHVCGARETTTLRPVRAPGKASRELARSRDRLK